MNYKLIDANDIMSCGIDLSSDKNVTLTILDIFGDKGSSNNLNHISYMASYIWTILQFRIALEQSDKSECYALIDTMQKYLVNFGYTINYMQPIVIDTESLNISENNNSHNGIHTYQIKELLETKDKFKDYLNMVWIRFSNNKESEEK